MIFLLIYKTTERVCTFSPVCTMFVGSYRLWINNGWKLLLPTSSFKNLKGIPTFRFFELATIKMHDFHWLWRNLCAHLPTIKQPSLPQQRWWVIQHRCSLLYLYTALARVIISTLCMTEGATFMHWFLLLVAWSIGKNLQLLPGAPLLTHLMTCDVFLAPSTIPGSACMRA